MPKHSINAISEFTGTACATLRKRIRDLDIPTTKVKNRKLVAFDSLFVLRSASAEGEIDDLSPSDRRNVAQARKLEAETAVLEKDFMPVGAAVEILGRSLDILQQDLEKWDRDPAERAEIVERLQETLKDGLAEYIS